MIPTPHARPPNHRRENKNHTTETALFGKTALFVIPQQVRQTTHQPPKANVIQPGPPFSKRDAIRHSRAHTTCAAAPRGAGKAFWEACSNLCRDGHGVVSLQTWRLGHGGERNRQRQLENSFKKTRVRSDWSGVREARKGSSCACAWARHPSSRDAKPAVPGL